MHLSTPPLAASPDPQQRAPAYSLERKQVHYSNSASHHCTLEAIFKQISKRPNKQPLVDPLKCYFCVNIVGSTTRCSTTALGTGSLRDPGSTFSIRYLRDPLSCRQLGIADPLLLGYIHPGLTADRSKSSTGLGTRNIPTGNPGLSTTDLRFHNDPGVRPPKEDYRSCQADRSTNHSSRFSTWDPRAYFEAQLPTRGGVRQAGSRPFHLQDRRSRGESL